MRIKRLELVGFKSFVEQTCLNFAPGLSAIVGPNGCGKSNLVDAIRWVLGEQSPKHLRGAVMEDVIFAGNERRAPLGMAEVALTFANDGAPVEPAGDEPELDLATIPARVRTLPEITVTRRYYRSGESEYFINRSPCRLKDITELFLGTGVGTKAYAIIEQGRVEQLVGAKPEERRWFIEEAAGTTLYRSRRQAAERKMERTRENLARVSDVLREVERQIQYLHRQARKAEQYRNLRAEIRTLEIGLSAAQWGTLKAAIGEAEGSRAGLREEEGRLVAALRDAEAARMRAEQARSAAEERLARLREEAAQAGAEAEMLRQRAAWLGEETTEREGRVERLRQEAGLLAGRTERLARDAEEIGAERRACEERLAAQQPALDTTMQAVEQRKSAAASAASDIEDIKGKLVGVLSLEAGGRNELTALGKRKQEVEQRRERLAVEESQVREELQAVDHRLEERRQSLAALREQLRALHAEREQRAARVQQLEGERRQIEHRAGAAEERLLQFRSRLRSLEEIQQQYEGYQRGVRATMLREQSLGGVLGVVGEVISTPREYERAVAAVLGERLQYVIVSGEEQGLGAVRALRAEQSGRGSFVPRSPRRGSLRSRDPSVPRNGGSRRLLDLVRVDEGYRDVAEWLLSDAVLVPDLSTALSLWRQNGKRVTLVTPEGDLIDAAGVITGGSDRPIEEEILSRGREIEELRQTVAALDAEYARASGELARVAVAGETEDVALRQLDAQLQELTLAAMGAEKECEHLQAGRPRWVERLQLIAFDGAAARREEEELQRQRAARESELNELGAERRRLDGELEASQRAYTQLRSEADVLVEELATTRVQFAGDRERFQALAARAGEIARYRKEVENQTARLEAEQQEITAESKALTEEKSRVEKAGAEARERRQVLAAEIRAVTAQVGEAQAAVGREEEALVTVRQALDRNRGEGARCDTTLAEHRVRVEHLEQSMREKHGVELAVEVTGAAPQEPEAERAARLEQLRERLARLGEVNPAAIEEFNELEDRARFLRSQKEDLERSMEHLERTIARLNRASRARFRETFARADEKFRAVFPQLFGGGEARLVLTDERNILECGVEIFVRPPGKKLEKVTLLSGGEKALVAVSLIFALFLINPTPFCFLDEVDAPLDDANVGRFVQMVREMRAQSQFIIVTHNKRTMETADCLYGVTMEEPGVSKIISVAMR